MPCEWLEPKTLSPVSVWVSKWTSPSVPWRGRAGTHVGLSDRVIAAEHDRDRPRGEHLGDRPLDRLVRAQWIGRDDGRIAVVDDAQRREGIDLCLEVRARRGAGRTDAARPEARPGTVRDELVDRRAEDRDIDTRELARVLGVRLAGEA